MGFSYVDWKEPACLGICGVVEFKNYASRSEAQVKSKCYVDGTSSSCFYNGECGSEGGYGGGLYVVIWPEKAIGCLACYLLPGTSKLQLLLYLLTRVGVSKTLSYMCYRPFDESFRLPVVDPNVKIGLFVYSADKLCTFCFVGLGQLQRACVELAKMWRQDKMLRDLDVSGQGEPRGRGDEGGGVKGGRKQCWGLGGGGGGNGKGRRGGGNGQ